MQTTGAHQNISAGAVEMKPGGAFIRLVATIIDGLILMIVTLPIGLVFGVLQASNPGEVNYGMIGLNYLFSFAATFLYYGWFYSNKGATPGKLLFKLRVVDATTGSYLSYGQTALRELLGKFVSAIALMIGFLIIPFRADKRGFHDFIGKSQVIRAQ